LSSRSTSSATRVRRSQRLTPGERAGFHRKDSKNCRQYGLHAGHSCGSIIHPAEDSKPPIPGDRHVEAARARPEGTYARPACDRADGAKVFCAAMLEIEAGKIIRQTAVQAWDAWPYPVSRSALGSVSGHQLRLRRSLRDRERKQKSDAVRGSYQMDRTTMGAQHRSISSPIPVPPLARLVVKNGVKILSRLLSAIGSPSFVTATETMSADLWAWMRKVLA
jgi:hypothetical protein